MESPLNLLKLAVGENDSNIRTSQVIKACKIITTLLPFDRKNHTLVEESELMKYLLLALPINPRSIDMIILSMIKKFKKLHYFLKELWYAFTMIAQLEEPRGPSAMKSDSAMRLYQNDVKKLLKLATLKDLDEVSYNANSRVSEFCDIVTENKEWIKLSTLEYVDQVIELYNQELKTSVAFKPDIAELLKKFIIFSPSDKVIIRVCAIIEKVSFIEKNSMLNHEIEQLVLNKQSMVIDSSFASKANIEDTPRVRGKVKLKRALSKIKEEKQESVEIRRSGTYGGASPRSNKSPTRSPTQSPAKRSITFKDEEGTSLAHLDEHSPLVTEPVEVRLERWLSEGEMEDVPIISKNAYIYNMFKNPGNYEIILSFIFDPQAYPIAECWKENYPSLTDGLEESSLSQSGLSNPFKFQRLKEDDFMHPYIFRSYKTMLAFCDPGNMKYFIQMDSSAFENYFSFLYACLNTRDDSACNFNHIAKVTEFLLRKEPEVSVNYLIYYNLLYKFIQNLEFPVIEQFFLTLFNCSLSHVRIGDDAYRKIMKYCEIVSFFSDLAQAMLTGLKSLDLKKSEVYYKPVGVEALVNGAMKKSDIVGFDDNPLTERRESQDCFLEDELNGTNLDVDALYSITQSQVAKNFDKKKIIFAKKGTQRVHSQSVINRYASLREKYLHQDRGENNDDQYLDSRNTLLETPRRQNSKSNINILKHKSSFQFDEKKNSIVIKSLNPLSPKNTMVFPNNAHSPTNMLASRQSLNHNTIEHTLKGEERSKDDRPTLTTANGGFRSVRGGRSATEEGDGYDPGYISSNNGIKSGQEWNSRKTLEKKRTLLQNYYVPNYVVPPERITLAKELINDVMTNETAQQLNVLYPISSLNRVETEVDKEAKKTDFTASNIRQNEQFAQQACNLFETLVRRALFYPTEEEEEEMKERTKNEDKGKRRRIGLKRKLGYFENDYTPFWDAMFITNNTVFEKLLRNYLLKIKIHNLEEMNSGYSAGSIVNMMLSKCETHPQLSKFFTIIHTICKDHLKFLCKVIIQSHAWPARKDTKVYLQNYEVTEPLGPGRILLVETLYWILKNDLININSKIVFEINDTCWHTLIVWFFSKKSNNAYLRLFYTILEMTFKRGGEKFILNLLFKLEILSSMYRVWGEVYLNNVLIKDNYNESIICYMKKLALLIESTATTNEKYATLRSQLEANISWGHLKLKLCPRPEKKKEPSSAPRRGSKMTKPRDSAFSIRNTPRTESRNSIIHKTLILNKRDSVLKMPPIATSNMK